MTPSRPSVPEDPLHWPPLKPWSGTPTCRPREIVAEALKIAADICIYTNSSTTIEEL